MFAFLSKLISKTRPIFIENSWVPKFLSKFAPINIGAITLGFFVFSRGVVSESTRRHETIHLHQQIETGFLLFYVLYLYYWLKSKVKGIPGDESYMLIPFEKEAYTNELDQEYLQKRKFWAWTKYIE